MAESLADMLRDRADRAFGAADAIEVKVSAVIPQLQNVGPVLDKSGLKQEAIITALIEVTELARDVKSEISASRAHLGEGAELLEGIRRAVMAHRLDMANVATFTRNLRVFLQDPVYLKEVIKLVGIETVKELLREIESAQRSGDP